MAAKMIPAPIEAKPVQRMRLAPVIFILLSLITAVWRLVFMGLSPSMVAVCLTARILSFVAIIFSWLINSGKAKLYALAPASDGGRRCGFWGLQPARNEAKADLLSPLSAEVAGRISMLDLCRIGLAGADPGDRD